MTGFWTLSDNSQPSGSEEASFVKDFSIIPDGTQAIAEIKEFVLVEEPRKLYEITYKITSADFKGREVRMKIKCFDDKPSIRDRGINLLKRVYDLCGHKPSHNNEPSSKDLVPMIGKSLGIKIKEFIGTKQDGTPSNGNYVSECYKADKDFEVLTGVKLAVPSNDLLSPNGQKSINEQIDDALAMDVPF